MKVLITGANGLVGQAVAAHCAAQGDTVAAFSRQRLDIGDAGAVAIALQSERPDYVINCAAWTDVDGCQSDREKAYRINALGPENLAHACRGRGAGLVTISTDYVFDGGKDGFYTQRDDPNPLSVYAASKLAGERLPQTGYARTIVVRSGWIYGPGGRNFLSRIVELARGGVNLSAINDAFGTPTYAPDLAVRLRELALLDLPGVFHAVNRGPGVSYEQFARYALQTAGLPDAALRSVSDASLQRPAPRPSNTRLHCLWSERLGLPAMPDWADALRRWLPR